MVFIRLVCFCIVMLVYLWVPFSMITQQEDILEEGKTFLFRSRPVDPYDAFRGRYVALSFTGNTMAKNANTANFRQGEKVYTTLKLDSLGYAFFDVLYVSPPDHSNYIETQVAYVGEKRITLKVPENLRRYYLNEKLAPLAEKAYRELSRQQRNNSEVNAYLQVKVLDGKVLLEDLYLKGQPVGEYLKSLAKE